MGNQFSKTWELICITANQIAYPPEQPPNTPIKQPSQSQKPPEPSIFNIRDRLFDNQGWLPIKFDFANFKPKKFYKECDDVQLQNYLKALQKKQQLIKRFKYYQDFDRIDYGKQDRSATFETITQKMFFGHIFMMLFISRIAMINEQFAQTSFSLWKRYFSKYYFSTLPLLCISIFFTQSANPINHEYFKSSQNTKRVYQGYAYDLDIYQYVNDTKYNFKYPKTQEYTETVKNIRQKINQYKYEDSIRYWKKVYGIVDTQKYLYDTRQLQKKQQPSS